jgi:hypothetical protein
MEGCAFSHQPLRPFGVPTWSTIRRVPQHCSHLNELCQHFSVSPSHHRYRLVSSFWNSERIPRPHVTTLAPSRGAATNCRQLSPTVKGCVRPVNTAESYRKHVHRSLWRTLGYYLSIEAKTEPVGEPGVRLSADLWLCTSHQSPVRLGNEPVHHSPTPMAVFPPETALLQLQVRVFAILRAVGQKSHRRGGQGLVFQKDARSHCSLAVALLLRLHPISCLKSLRGGAVYQSFDHVSESPGRTSLEFQRHSLKEGSHRLLL